MTNNSSHEPPIALEGFNLLNFTVDAFEGFDCDADRAESRLEVAFVPELHPKDPRVTLSVTMAPETESSNVPYSLSSRSAGYFLAKQEIRRGAVDPGLFVNALTIMYGALRGIVLQCTAAASHGPALLPTVMMVDVVASHIAREEKAALEGHVEQARPKTRKAPNTRKTSKKK